MSKYGYTLFVGSLLGAFACTADRLQIGDDSVEDAGGDRDAGSGTGGAPGAGGTGVTPNGGAVGTGGWTTSPPPGGLCGNGVIEREEACDDGNSVGLDGCSSLCQIEAGYHCPSAGYPCLRYHQCGDGFVAPTELCDDGNNASGDGCSADCQTIEVGWFCPVPGTRCRPRCGDARLVGTETCDDGNVVSGDGCSSTCDVEPGASCSSPGKPCLFPVCGNGRVEPGEICDCGTDPAALPNGCMGPNGLFYGGGKGCSSTCTQEPTCQDASGKTHACTTSCGDGNLDPGEECDDGNRQNADGCSSQCRLEPGSTCSTVVVQDTRTCRSGSGQCLVLPVLYRDFLPENAATGGHPDFFFLGAKYGGSKAPTTICVPDSAGPAHGNDSTKRCWGLMADTLVGGKPQPGATTRCECQFSDWSIANASRIPGNYTQAGNDSPLSDGNGGFRGKSSGSVVTTTGAIGYYDGILAGFTLSSPGGAIWKGTTPAYKNAAGLGQWFTDDATVNKTYTSVIEMNAIGTNVYQYASTAHLAQGGFFPLDTLNPVQATLCNLWPYWNHGDGSAIWSTCAGDQYFLPPRVNASDCPAGTTLSNGCWVAQVPGERHDYYFTEEARHHFLYDGSLGTTLSVYADHDLFIFVNGVLVLDLGGTHQALPGKVTITGSPGDAQVTEGGCLDAAGNIVGTAAGATDCAPAGASAPPAASPDDFRARTVKLGLESGKIYELAIFGANRRPTESTLQITLSGSVAKRSMCMPTCGDGVVSAGEECDNGPANDERAYGGCTTRCTFGPFCGDGIVQSPQEQCDQGENNGTGAFGPDGCTAACTVPHYCGDGILDAELGEQCDLGAQNGVPGQLCDHYCRVGEI
jgi:fibro-slime domain-containing protein